jgi:hypothetical protein
VKRFFGHRLLLGAGIVVVMALCFANRGESQDPNAKPEFGEVTLKAGFDPDPVSQKVVAGGTVKTNLGGVTAFVGKVPDYRLNYEAGKYTLTIHVKSDADTTLLINTPDGKWIANDDGPGNGLNPLLKFDPPQSGRYDIFVGTLKDQNAPATLFITERKVP